MITKNYKNTVKCLLESCSSEKKGLLPVTTSQKINVFVSAYFYDTSLFPYSTKTTVSLGGTTSGIQIGSGTTPASEDDYALEAIITSGFSSSVSSVNGVDEDDNPYLIFNVMITNTSASDITVGEIGYSQTMYCTTEKGSEKSGDRYNLLFDRSVLDEPVTIPPNETKAIKYTLKTVSLSGSSGAYWRVRYYKGKSLANEEYVINGGSATWGAGKEWAVEQDGQPVDGILENVSSNLDLYSVGGSVEIVPFASGTDEQIAAMVAAMDAGTLSPEDTGWKVGDERKISLAAMGDGGYVGESQAAQEMTFVIMDTDHYELTEATAGGDTKCHFVVGMKQELATAGYMNPSNTNSGSWKESKRRAWCNDTFRAAIPETLRACFKQFKALTASVYNGTTNEYTDDYFALFAEKEIFGSRSYSNQTEFDALTQIEYYKTAANRIKKRGETGSANSWWERSPYYGGSSHFSDVNSDGDALYGYASFTGGIAPFGCL